MSNLDTRLREDRAMRDAAKRLVEADLGIVKGDVKERGVADRVTDTVRSSSHTVADSAMAFAVQRPLMVSGVLIAVLGFFFRDAIIDTVIDFLGDDDEDHDTVTAAHADRYSRVDEPDGDPHTGTRDNGGRK